MKRAYVYLLTILIVLNSTLFANSWIHLKFNSDLRIDSIRIDNIDLSCSQTFYSQDELILFYESPTVVIAPSLQNDYVQVRSQYQLEEVRILVNLQNPGRVSCEIFDLKGQRVSGLTRVLEKGLQRFSFLPSARGVYLLQITTPTTTITEKFVASQTTPVSKLMYVGSSGHFDERPHHVAEVNYASNPFIVRKDDLLRIYCYSGTELQTIYEYANADKQYTLRFTYSYHQLRLFSGVYSKSGLLDVMFSVNDESGQGVDVLKNPDYVLKEDGVILSASESFRHVARMEQVPFSIALLIDNSSELINDLANVKNAAVQFVRKIRPHQQIAVYVFSEAPVLLQNYTNDTTLLKQAIENIQIGSSSSNLYGSLINTLSTWNDEFSQTNIKQGALVLFTDGNDTRGSSTLSQVITARGQKRVYVIGMGNQVTPTILNQISYPGEYISISSCENLEQAFSQIQADIVHYSTSFYWMNYMSPKRSGSHTFTVSTVDNSNTTSNSSISANFNADGFQSVTSGVYVNIDDSKLYGIDSVFCFYSPEKSYYRTTRWGDSFTEDGFDLKPISYRAHKQPQFNWVLGNTNSLSLDNSFETTKVLKINDLEYASTTILNIQDIANDFSKQLIVQLHPVWPIVKSNHFIYTEGQTATIQGEVQNEGMYPVITRGFVWGTYPDPTVNLSTKTTNGKGTGLFTSSIPDLIESTTYYVRAYATNSAGTVYGKPIRFTATARSPVSTVTSPTGQVWMDRNLGAGRVATSSTDAEAYGDLYQWGRDADGHEKRISETTTIVSSSDTPGHGQFIIGSYDWRSLQNDNLWQGENGINNPCPKGFRIPTAAEWDAERVNWSSNNLAGAFASPLKLPVAGERHTTRGLLNSEGSIGHYWSATVDGTYAHSLYLSNSVASLNSYIRAYGFSVRCIKDTVGFTLPTLSTISISSITNSSASSGGTITSDGGSVIASRGVVWSTSPDPTISLSTKTNDGKGTGSFTRIITGLLASTTYYVKAYATNSAGTAYGNQVSFTTAATSPFSDVNSPTGRVWMDRNLGAIRAATSSTDEYAYGDLYQWGRGTDGHEKRTSLTTSTLSSSDQPTHSNFITVKSSDYIDWRSPQNDNLWQGENGFNNPCPEGFRIPSVAEWEAESASWSNNNSEGAFESPLKLPLAGFRSGSSGTIGGTSGYYWSSSVWDYSVQSLNLSNSVASISFSFRATGMSVRCIKD